MLKGNSLNRVSVAEQMRTLNRINGLGYYGFPSQGIRSTTEGLRGLGDPVVQVIDEFANLAKDTISGVIRIFGGGGDPYSDIHIPAQNASEAGMAQILNTLAAKPTVTRADVTNAQNAIKAIYDNFTTYTRQLVAQHPHDASRYNAGAADISNLGKQIISDMNVRYASLPGTGVDPTTSGVSNFLSQNSTLVIAALAAFVFLNRK